MDRQAYLDDYGLQVDPLFDMVDELERQLSAEREANKRLREAAKAKLEIERDMAEAPCEGSRLAAATRNAKAYINLAALVEGKQNAHD